MREKKKVDKKIARKKKGVVVSDKADKTVVVEITAFKTHKMYKKKYRDTKRYRVHDEENKFKVGDEVFFEECRPISKNKKWIAINK